MSTASALYEGFVTHHRLAPRVHKFRYSVFALLIDLDELPRLTEGSLLFKRNAWAALSFFDRDHGDGGDLKQWLDRLLACHGINAAGPRRVLCYPRLFGFVFNPLSTWFCHASDGTLAAIVYEVHNTFGERHAYVLPVDPGNGRGNIPVRQECSKKFYVSPFLSMDCTYTFRIRPPRDDVMIAINETEANEPILTATFSGKRKPFSDAALLGVLLRHPLMTVKIIAAIHYEALRLMWKGVARHAHGAAA